MPKRKAEDKAIDLVKAYKATFATTEGQIVLMDLLKRARFNMPIFNDKATALQLAFREGERNLALYIVGTLELNIDDIRERLRQAQAREKLYGSVATQF